MAGFLMKYQGSPVSRRNSNQCQWTWSPPRAPAPALGPYASHCRSCTSALQRRRGWQPCDTATWRATTSLGPTRLAPR